MMGNSWVLTYASFLPSIFSSDVIPMSMLSSV